MKLSISSCGRHFVDEAERPFFWLADTAWNAALRGDSSDWRRYLDTRARQGFTVVQFVAGPWRGCTRPIHGALFVETPNGVDYDDQAWDKMEEWLAAVVASGLVPAPVMFWDLQHAEAAHLSNFRLDTYIEAGRRMRQRWARFHPVWILAGDGDYRSPAQAAKWTAIGRGIFGQDSDALVTLHPCGLSWINDLFAAEPWFRFAGIQSGHGARPDDLGFLLAGPYTTRWPHLRLPFVNLEPNYEMATPYGQSDMTYTAYHVRRAAWWSLLGAPIAGLTYGNNPTWIWPQTDHEAAEGHGATWAAGHWTTGLETEGISHLGVLRSILDSLPWRDLRPTDHLLVRQPGWSCIEHYQKASATPDGQTCVVYLPVGGVAALVAAAFDGARAEWCDPRHGGKQPCVLVDQGSRLEAHAPDDQDWLLIIHGKEMPVSGSPTTQTG